MTTLPSRRDVQTIPAAYILRDKNGHRYIDPRRDSFRRSRATQPVPLWDLLTDKLFLDLEFQRVKIAGKDKQVHRIGRLSVKNEQGVTVYDVFAYYEELSGHTKTLSARWRRLGVYWEDIQLNNGAVPVEEVEANMRKMLEGRIAVGHAIHNDIKVCSDWVFDGIEIRDTQKYFGYQRLLGTRQPGLARLSARVLGKIIQGTEHSSDEDAGITGELYQLHEVEIDAEQAGWVHRAATADLDDELDFGDEGDEDTFYYEEQAVDAEEEATKSTLAYRAHRLAQQPLSTSGSFWKSFTARKPASTTSTSDSTMLSTTHKRQESVVSLESAAATESTSDLSTASQRSSHTSLSSYSRGAIPNGITTKEAITEDSTVEPALTLPTHPQEAAATAYAEATKVFAKKVALPLSKPPTFCQKALSQAPIKYQTTSVEDETNHGPVAPAGTPAPTPSTPVVTKEHSPTTTDVLTIVSSTKLTWSQVVRGSIIGDGKATAGTMATGASASDKVLSAKHTC